MPAPIKKLNDRFADYDLTIRCKHCRHERQTEPHMLAKLLGWDTKLTDIAKRMRCSKCNSRGECELIARPHTSRRNPKNSRH
jgi:hypothetical protein